MSATSEITVLTKEHKEERRYETEEPLQLLVRVFGVKQEESRIRNPPELIRREEGAYCESHQERDEELCDWDDNQESSQWRDDNTH